MGASITKNGRNITEEAKGLTPIVESEPSVKVVTSQQVSSMDYIVINAYNSAAKFQIPIERAASIITGRIRVRFVEGIRNFVENDVHGFEVSNLQYLDEVLFNNLEYIVFSVMKFGSKGSCITMAQCLKMIRDTAKMIDYKIDQNSYDEIEKILKVVYNE